MRARQRVALDALLMGKTEREAAETAGVRLQTLRRWQQDPAWQAVVAKEHDRYGLTDEQLAQRTRRALLVKSHEAVERIETLARTGEIERNRLYADMFLVKTAVGKATADPAAPQVPPDLFKSVLMAYLAERERRGQHPGLAPQPALPGR